MQQAFPRGFGAKKDRATTGNGIFGFGRKFLLENQMVRDISLGKVQKILAAILGDAIFHVFLVCSANLDIFVAICSPTALNYKISTRVVCVNGKHAPDQWMP